MTEPGAPWWAEVQHLRPAQDRGTPVEPTPRERVPFPRDADAAIATVEHRPLPDMPEDPWATPPSPEESAARWAAVKDAPWMQAHARRAAAEDALFLARLTGEPPPPEALTALEDASAARADRAARRRPRPQPGPAAADAPAAGAEAVPEADVQEARRVPRMLFDDALEEAFTRTPAWASENDARLLPKGADRIENGRRTIEIRGQVDRIHGFAFAEPAPLGRAGRRRPSRTAMRLAGRPDRVAMWAFLLGLLLIVIAALSNPGDAGAAVLAP
jgi:hypothetical protein